MRIHELSQAALDFWSAKAAGLREPRIVGGACTIDGAPYRPSSVWSDGGPLIESRRISVWRYPDLDAWHACSRFNISREEGIQAKDYYQGATPLVAAMRCLVASRFGSEVLDG